MSTVKVNELSTYSGTDISIETGKTVSGTASQFKMTDVVQGDVLYGSAADTLSRLAPGTSGQQLQTQGAGANPIWAAAGGKVLQVLQSVKTDTATTTVNAGTFADITGTDQDGAGSVWCVKITPSVISSKILVSWDGQIGSNSANQTVIFKLFRNAVNPFLGDTGGSRVRASSIGSCSGGDENIQDCGGQYLDSPSLTSEITYKLQWSQEDAQTIYLNRAGIDTDNTAHSRSGSTITVMEIGA